MLKEIVSAADGGAESAVAVGAHTEVAAMHTMTAFEGALYQHYWFFLLLTVLFFAGKFLFLFPHTSAPFTVFVSRVGDHLRLPPISGHPALLTSYLSCRCH